MATTKIIPGVLDLNESTSESGLKIPSGTELNRPATDVAGMIRNNTNETSQGSASCEEYYNGTEWKKINTNPVVYASAISLSVDEYLNKTFSGNTQTVTMSFWSKTSYTNSRQFVYGQGIDGNHFATIEISSGGLLQTGSYVNGSLFNISNTNSFQDGVWRHFVVSYDTTQSTASDRIKLYVNGTEVTSFGSSDYPGLNLNTQWNGGDPMNIGKLPGFPTGFYNGELALMYFIDGNQYDASYFGETAGSRWIPKTFSGTYGSSGFLLDFSNANDLGNDTSGNNNDFTLNNIDSSNQTTLSF
jgi:hypothetical protein